MLSTEEYFFKRMSSSKRFAFPKIPANIETNLERLKKRE